MDVREALDRADRGREERAEAALASGLIPLSEGRGLRHGRHRLRSAHQRRRLAGLGGAARGEREHRLGRPRELRLGRAAARCNRSTDLPRLQSRPGARLATLAMFCGNPQFSELSAKGAFGGSGNINAIEPFGKWSLRARAGCLETPSGRLASLAFAEAKEIAAGILNDQQCPQRQVAKAPPAEILAPARHYQSEP